jgi:dTDP-4-dehydrorhamnose reductase
MDKEELRSKKFKILILGSTGQVGKTLTNLGINGFDIIFYKSKKNQNINNHTGIKSLILRTCPNIIINAAAYTNVELAEKKKKLVKKTNIYAVKNIATICKKEGIFLIHFSSDYIYGNNGIKLINENSQKKPMNFYGFTKLESEKIIRKTGCNYLILRTAWVYSQYRSNFFISIYNKLKNNNKLKVVGDQVGTPTSTIFLHYIIEKLLNKIKSKNFIFKKTFNCTPSGFTSWYNFAKKIEEKIFKKTVNISKINTSEFLCLAKRQLNSRLSNKKLENFLKVKIKSWKYYLNITVKKFNAN